ncbi:MAG: hypothetical protein ACWGMZ_10875 [Thermoguttaceae bacterium]
MSLNIYSPCPGGGSEKIKFCCPDLFPELEKIIRMIEGDQLAACLQHIERLREQPKNRDRKCLLAYQVSLLREIEKNEEAKNLAGYFLEKFPDNQVALAESAISKATDDMPGAMDLLQRSLAAAKGKLLWQICTAIEVLGNAFIDINRWIPARALLRFLLLVKKNEDISEKIIDLLNSPAIPLLLKEDLIAPAQPENAPWKERFQSACSSLAFGDWRTAEKNLTALADEFSDVPLIWRELTVLRGWLGETDRFVQAAKHYASLDIPREDAAEAEATAMFISEKPLGDSMPILKLSWTVNDAEPLLELLLSDPKLKRVNFDPSQLAGDNAPPPKAIFTVFDRPEPTDLENITAFSMPRLVGQLCLFGRQTDCEARLELLGVAAMEVAQIKKAIAELAGDLLATDEKVEELSTIPATVVFMNTRWRPPIELDRMRLIEMRTEFIRSALFNRWTELKLGALDGLSVKEAAADPRYHVKLQGALLVLQHYLDQNQLPIDLNQLRAELGLAVLEPIDYQADTKAFVPLARLHRLNLESLPDDELLKQYNRAVGYSHRSAVVKFAAEIVKRPSLAEKSEKLLAYMSLVHASDDFDKALEYIQAGRKIADAIDKSQHAIWDLEELSLRFSRREVPEIARLVNHIKTAHGNEPNILGMLAQMLVEEGVLRPDGSVPSHLLQEEDEEMAMANAEPEPAKLWTPDQETPGGGKLWVPD